MIRLRISVENVCGAALRNATVAASLDLGKGPTTLTPGVAPHDVLIPDQGPALVTLTVNAAGYYDEVAQINHDKSNAWTTNNPSLSLSTGSQLVPVTVRPGRVRFAPGVQLSESSPADRGFNAGGALIGNGTYYRGIWVLNKTWRSLKNGVAANVNGKGWDRFNFVDTNVPLDKCGSWVLLEYGDPPGFGSLRFLIGVWAPFNVGLTPAVVLQVTPNPLSPYYPTDRFPFAGAYPYGSVVRGSSSQKTGPLSVSDFVQPYVDLGSNRTLLSGQAFGVAYQIYGSRSDLFGTTLGPVVITPIPATIAGDFVREPFNCQEGLGRLVGEVLRFLFSQSMSLRNGSSGGQLAFKDGNTLFQRPDNAPWTSADEAGPPTNCTSTLLGHSAAVATMYDVTRIPTLAALRGGGATANAQRSAYFGAPLFGGSTPYFTQNWHGLWIIDGVAQPGRVWSPTPRSPAAAAWLSWMQQSGGRSVCAVYTPSGIAAPLVNGLVPCLAADAKSGAAGQVVEKKAGLIVWLRLSDDYLSAKKAADPAISPPFTLPAPLDTHNEIYYLGVGYAAQAFH